MSYGMQIRTVNGLENIENLRSLREVFRYLSTTSNGVVEVPHGANDSNSVVFFEINDGGSPPLFAWEGSTLQWGGLEFFSPTSNFFIIVCRFR